MHDRPHLEQALAARKDAFIIAAEHLKGSGLLNQVEAVVASIPGAEASLTDLFDPSIDRPPQVTVKGLAIVTEYATATSGITQDSWLRPQVTVWSDGRRLRMHRSEETWSQTPGSKLVRNLMNTFRTGDIDFDPELGRELLEQGLDSERLFTTFDPYR